MGKITWIAGDSIVETARGDVFINANNVTHNAGQQVKTTAKKTNYSSMNASPDTEPIGYYFTKDGKYIGDHNETENEVYVADSKTVITNKDGTRTTRFNNGQDLHIKYSDFQEAVSIITQEGDTQDPDEYKMLACIFYNHAGHNPDKLIPTLKHESSVYKNGKPNLRYPPTNNSLPVLSTRQGLIYQLLGGKDLTGGATQNDGNDFFAWGLHHGAFAYNTQTKKSYRTLKNDGMHAKFREYSEIIIPKEIFGIAKEKLWHLYPSGKTSWSIYNIKNIPIFEEVFSDPKNFKNDNFDYTTGYAGKKLIATAFAGATIYWKVE